MVRRIAFCMVSSHQTRDLECFADSSNIPWNLPTNFHSDLIAKIQQMSLLSLCGPPFLQSHLFLICVALTYNDSRITLHRTCQILWICQCNWLLVSSSARETSVGSSGFLEKFLFCMGKIFPLCCQVLYHNGVSMIVAGLTFFTKNFVIRGYQITENFRLGHDCTSTSFARSPCYFLSSSRCHNFGLSRSEKRYCAYLDPVPLLLAAPLVIHEESWESVDAVEHSYAPDSLWNLEAIPRLQFY